MKPQFDRVANTIDVTQSVDADANPPAAPVQRTSPRQIRDARFGGLSSLFGSATRELPRTARGAAPGSSRDIPAAGGALRDTTIENLSIAQEVLRNVRKTYYKNPNSKSSNKFRTRIDSALENERLRTAKLSINSMRDYSLRTISDIKNAVGHNCGELSRLAVDLLSGKNLRAVHIVIGGPTIAHAFAAILPKGCPEQKFWESDMHKWDAGIIICDPWSNIACPAPEFNTLFIEKLDKWEKDGKLLFHNGDWVSANNDQLKTAIIDGKKKTLFVSSPPRKVGFDIS